MNKLIIYLDQNFISDIAKLKIESKKELISPQIKELFEVIKQGVQEEKFVCPDSWIHLMETAAEGDDELKELIYDCQAYMGQTKMLPPWKIATNQFTDKLIEYYDIHENLPKWSRAFENNPNKRLERFKIRIKIPNLMPIQINDKSLDDLYLVRASGIKSNDQYKLEIEASRSVYKKRIRSDGALRYSLSQKSISIEKAEDFINSKIFEEIANIQIFSRMWSRNLSDKGRKKAHIRGDFNDIEHLSSFMPYCDIVATDRYMKNLVGNLGLDEKYNTKVFSMEGKSLDVLITLLKHELLTRSPANMSLFSIVCTKDPSNAHYSKKFLNKLNLARQKFHNIDEHLGKDVVTEVFLTQSKKVKVVMPSKDEINKAGPLAFNTEQQTEMMIFTYNFRRLYDLSTANIIEKIGELKKHLRGPATAIIDEETKFDEDINPNDSYLFYDIEDAIKKKLEFTERYKIRIIYHE